MTEEKTESPPPEPKFQLITGVEDKPKKVIIYGDGGIGKSSIGEQFPNPIFIQTENAGGTIAAPRLPVCKTYGDFLECMKLVGTGKFGEFDTIVIDSVTFLERLMFNHVCHVEQMSNVGDTKTLNGSKLQMGHGFVETMKLWDKLTNYFDHFIDKGMNVVLLGHVTQRTVKNSLDDEYDSATFNLGKWGRMYNPTEFLYNWSDFTFYVTEKITTINKETGINDTRTIAIGSGKRVIYTTNNPAYLAKRRAKMPPELPFEEGKGYAVIEQYLNTTQQ
jgi:GTPase SAR1 family protein